MTYVGSDESKDHLGHIQDNHSQTQNLYKKIYDNVNCSQGL